MESDNSATPSSTSDVSPTNNPSKETLPDDSRGALSKNAIDLERREHISGARAGDKYVRVVRPHSKEFRKVESGYLRATPHTAQPQGRVQSALARTKRLMIGDPLSNAQAVHERLTKLKALAVFSSDALSSVAYATEEILLILILAGVGALQLSLPIAATIIVLLFIVGFSYRQTIKAYPLGGGSYIVAKDNLGTLPSLTAGAALLIDYTLTVAVSVSAGVAAILSLFPGLVDYRIEFGVIAIGVITLFNLRGIRESGSIFAIPTYVFIACMFGLIGVGLFRAVTGTLPPVPVSEEAHSAVETLGVLLVLRAFASGCTALTGVEAISDGVPAFKPPEWKNARTTLTAMLIILAIMFGGITFLAHQLGIQPAHGGPETVLSQIARAVFGEGPLHFLVQIATALILVLAANTAFSDFPRLAYFLARDDFLPHQFTLRGDRLAYSIGIVTLGLLSALLLAAFGGLTSSLIPLYAVGVFLSFTLSQSGMVVRWWRRREPGWQRGLVINAVGAIATFVVLIIIAVSKFAPEESRPFGAWIVIMLIPVLIFLLYSIHRHYQRFREELEAETPTDPKAIKHTIVVPIARLNHVAKQTLAYARSISPRVVAVHISDSPEEIEQLRQAWKQCGLDLQLVVIESPYRSIVGPLLAYIDDLDKQDPDDTVTVILPEFVTSRWWEHLLHNQTALRLKAALLFRPGTVVTSVPYHMKRRPRKGKAVIPPEDSF